MSTLTATENPAVEPEPADQALEQANKLARAQLDNSASAAVSNLYFCAIGWLVIWSFLNLILILKLQFPDFLGSCGWLTYGRLRPLASNIFIYGWASQAGIGTALWLMVRMCRVKLPSGWSIFIGTHFWNFGLTAGCIALLAGHQRPYENLELPAWSHLIMLAGFAPSLLAVLGMFFHRKKEGEFVSQMYLAAAFVWFAWTLLAANVFVSLPWIKGIALAINEAWLVGNLQSFWFISLGLGTAYYLIPKVTGKPIHSYYLAILGFWSFAFIYPLTSLTRFNGGPIPVWLVTLGIVATVLTIIPVAVVAVNHNRTMTGSHYLMQYSPTLRFTAAGTMCYTGSALVAVVLSLRSMSETLGLTYVTVAQSHLVLYAFFSMIMFGAIYFIMPRLVNREWISSRLIKYHFFGVAYGIGLMIFSFGIAGIFQGSDWNNPAVTKAASITQAVSPLLFGATLGAILLIFGHLILAGHFLLMLARLGQVSMEPTLIAPIEHKEALV